MKILHVSHLYTRPYDPILGIAMRKQIKFISNKGIEQKVISPGPFAPFPINKLSAKWNAYSLVPFHKTLDQIDVFFPRYIVFPKAVFYSSSGIRMYKSIKRLLKSLEWDFTFDLIHAHMALPDGYAGMLLSKEYKKPLVVTFQATDLDITAKRGKRSLNALKKVFKYADHVVSPTPRLAKQLISQLNIEPQTIGYGIDGADIIFKRDYPQFNKTKKQRILLSVSRLIPTKGIDLNIRAMSYLTKQNKNLFYLIVGDGPEKTKLKQLVKELDLTEHVEFIGQVSYQKVMEYMSICEIFSLPSWQETFGLVYIEAMALGKPVIGVRGQGIDGIIKDKETGLLVKPKDVTSLTTALEYLLSNPESTKTMAEEGRKLVVNNFTWERIAEKTIQLYEDTLRNR